MYLPFPITQVIEAVNDPFYLKIILRIHFEKNRVLYLLYWRRKWLMFAVIPAETVCSQFEVVVHGKTFLHNNHVLVPFFVPPLGEMIDDTIKQRKTTLHHLAVEKFQTFMHPSSQKGFYTFIRFTDVVNITELVLCWALLIQGKTGV
jgi:hypothetical protein